MENGGFKSLNMNRRICVERRKHFYFNNTCMRTRAYKHLRRGVETNNVNNFKNNYKIIDQLRLTCLYYELIKVNHHF